MRFAQLPILLLALVGCMGTQDNLSQPQAELESMKADLESLIRAQEANFADSGAYTTSFPISAYTVSSGTIGPTITLTKDGWCGSVGHKLTTRTCAVYVGSVPLAPAVEEGVPRCTR